MPEYFNISFEKKRRLSLAGLLSEAEIHFPYTNIPKDVIYLHDLFKKHGHKLFLVGGAVRDMVLKKSPKDWDLVGDATPDEIINILNSEKVRFIETGKQFGVITAVLNDDSYEIAVFRTDYYDGSDGRRPSAIGKDRVTMQDDYVRRDLSFNAMYYDLDTQTIIDFAGGYDDLINKKIKAVGNPFDRFQEDRLRVLRFIRFSHRFGSKIDDETKKAILHFNTLPGVSMERIRDEFIKGLNGAIHPEKYIHDYIIFGLFDRMFPNMKINNDVITNIKDTILVLANLLKFNPVNDVKRVLLDFKSTISEMNNVEFLIKFCNLFKKFDKNYALDHAKNIYILLKDLKTKNTNITEEQLLMWGKINHIDSNIVKIFFNFTMPYSAKDFPELKKEALGNAIMISNVKHFIKEI